MLHYDLQITPHAPAYRWQLFNMDNQSPLLSGTFQLDTFQLKGKTYPLTTLLEAFIHFDKALLSSFDEASQLYLGKQLYQTLFAKAPATLFPSQTDISLRIVSEDAFIQRIPWNLLTRDKTFLVLENWHISLAQSSTLPTTTVHFTAAPKVLLVCQEPRDQAVNAASEHAAHLKEYLCSHYHYFNQSPALSVASTWNSFIQKLQEQTWDVIYYYGHGAGDAEGATLLFSNEQGETVPIPMLRLAHVLKDKAPQVLYLNACRSANQGIAGSVTHLADWIPALIVNRTDAFIEAARNQAKQLLGHLLLDHYPPHQAITQTYQTQGHGLRWMTPLLYRHYGHWSFPDSSVQRFVAKDMHWHLKLDRTRQFERVFMLVSNMIKYSLRLLVCFWYGTKEQGVERFHERLPLELQHRMNIEIISFHFRWPAHFTDPHIAFERMVCSGFGLGVLNRLGETLQHYSTSDIDTPFIVHCRFETLRQGGATKLRDLELFLNWWNHEVYPLLQSYNLRVLMAFGYELEEAAPKFGSICRQTLEAIERKSGMKLEILNELKQVEVEDIREFLELFEVELPVNRQELEHLLEQMLERSQGNYSHVLDELRTIVAQAYKLVAQQRLTSSANTEHDY